MSEKDYDWVTLLHSRKLTEHCKQAIIEKIKIIKKKKKVLFSKDQQAMATCSAAIARTFNFFTKEKA